MFNSFAFATDVKISAADWSIKALEFISLVYGKPMYGLSEFTKAISFAEKLCLLSARGLFAAIDANSENNLPIAIE